MPVSDTIHITNYNIFEMDTSVLRTVFSLFGSNCLVLAPL